MGVLGALGTIGTIFNSVKDFILSMGGLIKDETQHITFEDAYSLAQGIVDELHTLYTLEGQYVIDACKNFNTRLINSGYSVEWSLSDLWIVTNPVGMAGGYMQRIDNHYRTQPLHSYKRTSGTAREQIESYCVPIFITFFRPTPDWETQYWLGQITYWLQDEMAKASGVSAQYNSATGQWVAGGGTSGIGTPTQPIALAGMDTTTMLILAGVAFGLLTRKKGR